MPRGRVLKSVAHNIVAMFMSRNNDAGGYWAFGLILANALKTGETMFTIDCITGQASTVFELAPLRDLPHRYHEIFWSQVHRQCIPPGRIQHAVIEVIFDFDLPRKRSGNTGVTEYRTTCRVRIVDDREKTYEETVGCWCFPHNPALTLQRRPATALEKLGRWLLRNIP
jgi:hypothetical protein